IPDPDGGERLLPSHPPERDDLPSRYRPAEHRDRAGRPPRPRPDTPPDGPASLLDPAPGSRPVAPETPLPSAVPAHSRDQRHASTANNPSFRAGYPHQMPQPSRPP